MANPVKEVQIDKPDVRRFAVDRRPTARPQDVIKTLGVPRLKDPHPHNTGHRATSIEVEWKEGLSTWIVNVTYGEAE